jgi:ATP-dependent DNA helicase DinG
LDDAPKRDIQIAYSSWLKGRGFRPRRGQREMIAQVARTLAGSTPRICVIEAGTGTGKTAAYCLAAIPLAKALGKKVIISSATVALQEQVVFRDLPDLKLHTELDFTFALAKGRGRYVCLKSLDDRLSSGNKEEPLLFEAPGPNQLVVYERMFQRFSDGVWNGELDDWDEPIDNDVWQDVITDHRGCSNKRCAFFHRCPFFKARNCIESADVVVANHDLVLSDLGLGGGVVLPAPAETIFIVDEAHHLPNKAQQHFTLRARLRATTQWLEQVNTSVGTCAQHFSRPKELVAIAEALPEETAVVADLVDQIEAIAVQLNFNRPDDKRDNFRFPMGRVPEELAEICEPLVDYFEAIARRLDTLHGYLEEVLDGQRDWPNTDQAEDWLGVTGQLVNRALANTMLFRDFANAADPGGLPAARWVGRLSHEVGDDLELVSAPLEPGTVLQKVLWDACYGAVCTSATIFAVGSFRRFLEQTGLPESTDQCRIPSPFDFQRLASLTVPPMSTDPRDVDAHTDEVGRMLPELLAKEQSALVLFTSWRQFRRVVENLPKCVLKRCHLQGGGSKRHLIEAHRAAIDGGDVSYILGLASFAEGVDLPDNYCRHVIITKLPFSVPDDPVDQAFGEWLETQGRNPFFEMVVPDTALRLVQSCGRLIRHEEDYGRITLLDQRILKLGYGRALLDTLPPYRLELGTASS